MFHIYWELHSHIGFDLTVRQPFTKTKSYNLFSDYLHIYGALPIQNSFNASILQI